MTPTLTLRRNNFFEFVFPEVNLLTKGLLVLGCSGLMALSSRLSLPLPFTPVPVTGQTLAVLLLSGLLGMRMAISVQLLYLAQGLAGLPVFAPGATWGFARLLGPTGGYLAGFVAAAAIVGWMADRGYGKRLGSALVMVLSGNLAILAVGVPWLKWVMQVDWGQAVTLGMWPFLIGDLYKIVLAAMLLPGSWRLVSRLHRPAA
ncbi:MAG: biotin transporter BioY [Acidobacteriia bacterium]|nr:biotin transporter BioY [Terriglobia bacterium]